MLTTKVRRGGLTSAKMTSFGGIAGASHATSTVTSACATTTETTRRMQTACRPQKHAAARVALQWRMPWHTAHVWTTATGGTSLVQVVLPITSWSCAMSMVIPRGQEGCRLWMHASAPAPTEVTQNIPPLQNHRGPQSWLHVSAQPL